MCPFCGYSFESRQKCGKRTEVKTAKAPEPVYQQPLVQEPEQIQKGKGSQFGFLEGKRGKTISKKLLIGIVVSIVLVFPGTLPIGAVVVVLLLRGRD